MEKKNFVFVRLVDGETIVLAPVKESSIKNGEIVLINGYQYKTIII